MQGCWNTGMPAEEEKQGSQTCSSDQRIVHGKLNELDIFVPLGKEVSELRVKHGAQHFIDDAILALHIPMTVRRMRRAVLD